MDMIQTLLSEGISIHNQIAVEDFFKSRYGIRLDGYVTYEEFCSSLRAKTSFVIQNGKTLHKSFFGKFPELEKAPFLAQQNTRHTWEMYFVLYE